MLVGIDRVITAVNERYLKIYQRITGDGTGSCGLDDAFFDGGAEILRNGTAKDLVHPFESGAACKWLENDFAIAKLPASAGLFLVPSLDLDLLSDRFFVGNLWRMQRDLDVIALFQFLYDGFDMELAGTGENKLFGLRVAVEMQRRIFLKYFMQRSGDLFLIVARFWLDGKGYRGLRVFDLWINDRLGFIAQRIAGLGVL